MPRTLGDSLALLWKWTLAKPTDLALASVQSWVHDCHDQESTTVFESLYWLPSILRWFCTPFVCLHSSHFATKMMLSLVSVCVCVCVFCCSRWTSRAYDQRAIVMFVLLVMHMYSSAPTMTTAAPATTCNCYCLLIRNVAVNVTMWWSHYCKCISQCVYICVYVYTYMHS